MEHDLKPNKIKETSLTGIVGSYSDGMLDFRESLERLGTFINNLEDNRPPEKSAELAETPKEPETVVEKLRYQNRTLHSCNEEFSNLLARLSDII